MVYINNYNDFTWRVSDTNYFENKKVLFVFGDSWTNNTYINNFGNYPEKTWSYQLAKKLEYDCVVNISTDGGSNDDIFEWCLKIMCLGEDYEFGKCKIDQLNTKEIKVVIGWSSQLRNFNSTTKIFRPFNVTSIPYRWTEKSLQSLYEKYISNLHSEYYCFNTQIQTICLQHYFKYHKIDSYYFMAFTPLLEKELVETKWDLRNDIDKKRFYNLFEDSNNMAAKICEIANDKIKNQFVVDQPYFVHNLKDWFNEIFLNKKEFVEYLNTGGFKNKKYFLDDGHPNELGLEIISNELFELIKK
jgi:hypothetical protein